MKTIKQLTAIGLGAVLLAAAGCQTAENKNAPANSPANKTNANAPAATPAPSPTAALSSSEAGTPTEAYKASYNARKNKDVPALKKLLSKDVPEFFTEIAGLDDKKQTVDDLLMELCEKPQAPTAEVRNEKIDGNKATLEYLDEKGEWSPMEFVKEGGSWKLTIEKMDDAPPDNKKTKKK